MCSQWWLALAVSPSAAVWQQKRQHFRVDQRKMPVVIKTSHLGAIKKKACLTEPKSERVAEWDKPCQSVQLSHLTMKRDDSLF